jgi:integrator complex subunit 1
VASTVTSIVETHLNRRPTYDSVGRHVVKLMISAAGIPAVRFLAVQRLEVWMANPKLGRIAGDLLRAVAANLNVGGSTPGAAMETDKDVVNFLVRLRPKAKPQLNQFLACIREAAGRGKEIVGMILLFVIYNELSPNR